MIIVDNIESTHAKHKCPKCGAEEFIVQVHAKQDWKVDAYNNFIEPANTQLQLINRPKDTDIWTCANCGMTGTGNEFKQPSNTEP